MCRAMKAVFKREVRLLFTSLRTYLFLALMLAAGGACAFFFNLSTGNPQFCENVQYLALAMAALVPLLTAPTYASDRRQHVERLLLGLPIRPLAMAAGRFFACLIPVALACALTLLYPAALTFVGGSGMASSLGMAAALFCLGALLTAASLLASALTRAPWQAYLLSLAAFAASYFLPLAADRLLSAAALTTPAMACLTLALFLICWAVTGSAYAGLIGTVILDVPVVVSRMQDGGLTAARLAGRALAALAAFDPLGDFALGIVHLGTLAGYLIAAALLVALTALYLRGRRLGERRALA